MKNKTSSLKQTMGESQQNPPIQGPILARCEKNEAIEEPSSLKTSVTEPTKIDGNTTSLSKNGIKANARIDVEQDVNITLKT